MKKIYILISILFVVILSACQADEDKIAQQTGYLRLNIEQSNSVETKAEETYNPKMFSVKILDEQGQQCGSIIEDVSAMEAKEIPLNVGSYTVQVYSANYDEESGFGKAYYSGSTKVTIEAGQTTQALVTCTLANVMVTVKFSDEFKNQFQGRDFTVQVGSQTQDAFTPLNFNLTTEGEKGYIPVGDFQATISIPKPEGQSGNYTMTNKFDEVNAKQHYAITYKLQEEGKGDFTVKYDPSTNSYNYDFYLTTTPSNQATLTANAWSRFAYLKAENVTTESGTDISTLKFQYKLETAGDEAWADVETEKKGETGQETYEAKITGLTASTTYQYRLVNADVSFETTPITFTTEAEIELYNGSFDLWSQSGKTWYPSSSNEAGNTTSFWNTSNPGTSQGLAAIAGAKNPTTGVSDFVHTSGEGKFAAKLESTEQASVFAAASLYTGNFLGTQISSMSADMEFGKPFKAHPIALHGFYKYTPQVINKLDRKPDGVEIVQNQTMDQCAIFIALTTKTFTFNNKNEEEYIDYANDPAIIAYGELPSGEATSGEGYTEFTIPLKYKDLTAQPTHIIIVCSSSKYGDYMTGGTGSLMYVDDFELIYDGEPTLWE